MADSSLVIDDFNVVRVTTFPAEADAIAVVDANAVPPLTVACEFLQAIAGRNAKIVQ